MKEKTTKYQFTFIVLLLSAPAIFHLSPLKNSVVYGHQEEYSQPELTLDNWLSGKTQADADNYLSQEFGFRTDVIHFNNEWQFRLFNKANTQKVIIGKENYLFSKRYIDAYMGNDYIGDEKIKEKTEKLVELNKLIEGLDKKMIVIIAPGKGSFYPEFIPDEYFPRKEKTNHVALGAALEQHELNFIDFNSLFVSMKDTSSFPLYPKTGIHWSEYGLTMMADSLIKYVEKIKEVDLPDLKINSLRVEPRAEGTDIDIERSMNLIWQMPNISMAYPNVSFETTNKDTLKVLVMADSYYWQLFDLGISEKVFQNSQFFFYNNTIHPKPEEGSNEVKNLDLRKVLDQYEVIILMATEANLVQFPWDFDTRVLEAFAEKTLE